MRKKRLFIISIIVAFSLILSMGLAFISALNIVNQTTIVPQNKAILLTQKGDIELELAKTQSQHMIGLMNRTSMDLNKGMLFIFEKEEPRSFWMKDTLISLDIIFLDKDFKVVKIHKSTLPNQTEQIYYSQAPAMYVIELNSGASNTYLINESDILKILF